MSIDISKWRQGALFSAPSVYVVWNSLTYSQTGEPMIAQKIRKPRSKEKYVLISQTCDIKAEEGAEPYVEALLCTSNDVSKEKNRDFLYRLDRNSARRFVIDFDTGLVAEAKYRVPVAKEILSILIPEPWPGSTERFERFVRWLARRYDRPAIPDELVEAFQVPVENPLIQIDVTAPHIGAAFSRATHEIRINLPASEQPPFDLQMVIMVKRDALSAEEADAIDIVIGAIQSAVDPTIIHLNPEALIRTDEEISLAEHRATRPLFLEYLTYKGEEIEGVKAYERA